MLRKNPNLSQMSRTTFLSRTTERNYGMNDPQLGVKDSSGINSVFAAILNGFTMDSSRLVDIRMHETDDATLISNTLCSMCMVVFPTVIVFRGLYKLSIV